MATQTEPAEKLAGMREQKYKDPRPAEYFDDLYKRSQKRDPNGVHELVRVLTGLVTFLFFRARCVNAKYAWRRGGFLMAPNHFSFMDHFLTGAFTPRRMRFVAKSQMFKWYSRWFFSTGGVIPVRRGWHDERMFATVKMVLRKGRAVVMYLEGGRSRTGELSEKAYSGLGRLALESGKPVVPIAIYGSAKARNWKRLQFPKVTVEFGEPMFFPQVDDPSEEASQAVADTVHSEIHRMYYALEARGGRRKPRR